MSFLSNVTSAAKNLITSQVRTTPTGITSDELMFDPSNLHGHQGNNDDFVLTKEADNFQLFRSHDDMTLIYGNNDVASYWGGGNQSIYDFGHGTRLRFSELDQSQVKVFGLENDPTAKIDVWNPTVTTLTPDGHGGTMLGSIDFVGDGHVSLSQITFHHSVVPPSMTIGMVPL